MMRIISVLCMMGLVSSLHIDEPNDYCAQIVDSEANGAVGYFAMQIFEGVATYSYQLDLSNFKIKTCDLSNGLKYHIHSYWKSIGPDSASGPEQCGPSVTGGHYDPNLACGYDSNRCNALNRTAVTSCTPSKYAEGKFELCQIGDLSGKFDLAKGTTVFSQTSVLRDFQPPYPSDFLVANGFKDMWSSIVFHCSDDARLVCAKFKLVTHDAPSLCSFPPTSASYIETLEGKVKKGSKNLVVLGVAMFAFIVVYTIVIVLVWWRQMNIRKKLADSDFITL